MLHVYVSGCFLNKLFKLIKKIPALASDPQFNDFQRKKFIAKGFPYRSNDRQDYRVTLHPILDSLQHTFKSQVFPH